jgi:hypothetical protein
VQRSGLTNVYTGSAADNLIGAANGDPHVPDVIGLAQQGVVYTGGLGKIAEHGGNHAEDRDVPLTVTQSVATTQIAPTILKLLGLNPGSLQAVQREGTTTLPGI